MKQKMTDYIILNTSGTETANTERVLRISLGPPAVLLADVHGRTNLLKEPWSRYLLLGPYWRLHPAALCAMCRLQVSITSSATSAPMLE